MRSSDEENEETERFRAAVERTMCTPEARRDLQEECERFSASLKDGLDPPS